MADAPTDSTQTQNTSTVAQSSTMTDLTQLSDDPLFINKSENFSASLVTQPLVGVSNFINWKKSMEMVLGIKSKLGFVQGRFPKPTDPYQLTRWERCDNVILSWIINSVSKEIGASIIHCHGSVHAWNTLHMRFAGANNGPRLLQLHKEIVSLVQGEMDVPTYHGKLLSLWAEEEALEEDDLCDLGMSCKSTRSMEIKKQKSRLMQFLTGLNDVHSTVRTQVISMKPRPTLDEAYHMILEDEMQRGINRPAVVEISAMYASHHQGPQAFSSHQYSQQNHSNRQSQRNTAPGNPMNKNRRPLFCTNCQLQGHTKDTCYRIHGYPPGHKYYKGNTNYSSKSGFKNAANNVVLSDHADVQKNSSKDAGAAHEMNDMQSLSSMRLNQEQMTKLMSFLSMPSNDYHHVAGPSKTEYAMDW